MDRQERIRELEQQIADVRARLPKHSVPSAMMMELEDLEDELDSLRRQIQDNSSTNRDENQSGE